MVLAEVQKLSMVLPCISEEGMNKGLPWATLSYVRIFFYYTLKKIKINP